MKKFSLFAVALMALLTGWAQAAPPAARNFRAPCSGAQEVPPRATRARGVAVFNLDPTGTRIRFNLVVTRIQNVFAAHIHSGAVGVNGPVLVGLFGGAAGGGRVNGVLAKGTIVRGVTDLPASLGAGLTNAQRFDVLVALMRSGATYVNVHTNDGVGDPNTGPGDFPGGEIRGQIIPRP